MQRIVPVILLLRLAIPAGAMLFPWAAYSQSVPVQTDSMAMRYSGSAGFDFRLQGGNVRQQLYRFTASAQIENHTLWLNPSFIYSRNRLFANVLESDIFTYALFKLWPKRTIYPAASVMYENSVIRSIDFRYLAGAGMGVRLLTHKRASLEVMQQIVFDKTRFKITEELGYDGWRTHTALLGRYELVKEKLVLEHRIFHSFLLSEPSNHRLRTLATLKFPITRHLSLTGNIDYIFEQVTDAGRNRHNYNSSGGIAVQF